MATTGRLKSTKVSAKAQINKTNQVLNEAQRMATQSLKKEARVEQLYSAMQDLYREGVDATTRNEFLVNEINTLKLTLEQSIEANRNATQSLKAYKDEVAALKAETKTANEKLSTVVTEATAARRQATQAIQGSAEALNSSIATKSALQNYKDSELTEKVDELANQVAMLSEQLASLGKSGETSTTQLAAQVKKLSGQVEDLLGLGTMVVTLRRKLSQLEEDDV